jgi:uncharacterized protein (DUF983 family)
MIYYLVANKCPNCHKGNVFENSNLFTYKKDAMYKECPVCHTSYEKEPGFYWGAMYVSYALGVLEAFITYFICRLLGVGMFDWVNLYVVILAILLLSPFNFRMSRLVWQRIFY